MRKDDISEITYKLLECIGEDPERKGLQDTHGRRVPDMWEELSEGYRESEKPTMRAFDVDHDEMVAKTGINFYSLCEHHLLPFHGEAHIAYIPDGEVLGLSKLTRYTKWCSRKLHNQEELTREIAEGLMDEVDCKGVMVVLEAEHMCEQMRGVEGNGSVTKTSAVRGVFSDPPKGKNPRAEFQRMI